MSFPAKLPPRSGFQACDDYALGLDWYVAYGKGPEPSGAELGLAKRWESLKIRAEQLAARVATLEGKGGEPVVRVKAHLAEAGVTSAQWCWTPEDYYKRTLAERGVILGASVPQLCKTMLIENVAHDAGVATIDAAGGRSYERYYLVVLQYGAALEPAKLLAAMRDLRGPEGSAHRLGRSKYNLVMAEEARMNAIAGFPHNAVTPFGVETPDITVVLAQGITEVKPAFFWMGGGHPLLKLGCSLKDFTKALDPLVLDVSSPRLN
mmetsp:Transcript_17508/g.53599  ORF Transcript_17508/g.53599 Transcript_17508/m.53599 type:complete len:264 (-) Transcript_17508:283-1074(-)|eukprot:CAMPEP_0118866226 /NCGR_PEP_ID=MMETSP1163-20130328/10219_1 /TAXON_ID=124430 /ORGANISM="Phaeomonas parva, Strain CCMP2877" /LENGTH=263 /DNA_ID=CAMNT_0006800525 /DNA_START=301 /DNA_END=1092 /DNA_ORIENTATION=-